MGFQVADSLVAFILKKVKPADYFKAIYGGDGIRVPEHGEWRTRCHWHADSRPSLCINLDEGKFNCPACPASAPTKGGSIIAYERKLSDTPITELEACVKIYDRVVHPIIPFEQVLEWNRTLNAIPAARAKMASRLLSTEVIEKFGIGFDGSRFTLPVVDEFGLVTNVRRYDPLATKGKNKRLKVINYEDRNRPDAAYGKPFPLFGLQNLREVAQSDEKLIFVTEGELDALALTSICIPAVSSTAGAGAFPRQQVHLFRGLDVVFCYDNDTPGREGVLKAAQLLAKIARSVRIIEVPEGKGKDSTDWIKVDEAMQDRNVWIRYAMSASPISQTTQAPPDKNETRVLKLSLSHSTDARYYGKRIQIKGKVAGLDTTPYILPSKAHISCSLECDECPLREAGVNMREVTVSPDDPAILKLIDAPAKVVIHELCARAGVNAGASGCKAKCEVVEMFNVQGVLIGPVLVSDEVRTEPVYAYSVGHQLEANTNYYFEGKQHPAPRDQHGTILLDRRWPAHDIASTFRLTPEVLDALKTLRVPDDKALENVMNVAHWLSHVRAKIRGRDELAAAVDLVYHSVGSFNFCGDYVRRGMLDILVLGDTRCGKTQVVREVGAFYRMGEIVSGENCTFAGLVAGCHQQGDRWFTAWGALPANHGKLVAIDEANNIDHLLFSKLSRVRSEGVAEMDKIKRDRAPAMTRLIWIANPPKSAASLSHFTTGVEAVKALIGAPEDIARFDFVVALARDEVALTEINVVGVSKYDGMEVNEDALRNLLLWTWTRTAEQVRYTTAAEILTNQEANKLATEYSSAIPLIQGENVRVKIARIACSIAARCFSSDMTGEVLIVRPGHVRAAATFLRMMSNKPALGYDVYSSRLRSRDAKMDFRGVFIQLKTMMPVVDLRFTISELFSSSVINPRMLVDILSADMITASTFITMLMKAGGVQRIDDGRGNYEKTAGFTAWLRSHNGTDL